MSDVIEDVEVGTGENALSVGDVETEITAVPESVSEGDSPSAPGLSDAIMQRAKGYDLSSDDLEGLDETRLERMFSAIDRRIMQPQPQPQPGVAPAVEAGAPAAPVGREGFLPLKIDFGDDLDESVSKPIQAVIDHLNTGAKEMHMFRSAIQQELQALNMLREFSEFDRFLTGLGDDWHDIYGNGATVDLDPQSKEMATRLGVFDGAKRMLADARRRPGQAMNVSGSHLGSHRATHWDRIAGHERKKLNGELERRKKGLTERVAPGTSKTPAMSPRDEAIAVWNKK